jgi:hypothetical protein
MESEERWVLTRVHGVFVVVYECFLRLWLCCAGPVDTVDSRWGVFGACC